MPTRAGWGLVVLGALLIVAGRIIGAIELFVVGVITLAVVAAAIIYVLGRRLRLEVRRRIQPPKVHAGTASRVDLSLTNRSRRRSPVLTVHDGVSGTHGARLRVAPLRADASARAAYRLPTSKRGMVHVGPLDVTITDPLGLSRTRLVAAGVSELMVYPRVYAASPLPPGDSVDPFATSFQKMVLGRSGEDFHALRQYYQGDELRRVHWPSTARHDELMVRQEERPSLGRVTVVIDNRSAAMPEPALDLAASVAGSISIASQKQRDLVRVMAHGSTSGRYATSTPEVETILGFLAVLEATGESSALTAIREASSTDAGGALVVISCDPDIGDASGYRTLVARFATVTTVVLDPTSWDRSGRSLGLSTTARRIIVTGDNPFPECWNQAMSISRRQPHGAIV